MQVQVHILVNAQWQIVLKRDGCVFDENANWCNYKVLIFMIHFRKCLDPRLFW